MENRYDYDIIRDYLHGLVSREKAHEIGELIRTDDVARDIAEGILLMEKEFLENDTDIESYLEDFRQTQLRTIQTGALVIAERKVRNQWMKIAAAVLLLLVAFFGIRQITSQPDVLTLVDEELAEPYPVSGVFRSPTQHSDYNTAVELYRNKNFVQASLYFERAAKTENDLATVTFYNGMSSLYSGHYPRAIALLESRAVSASRYARQAEWYLSLAHIKSDHRDKAINILKGIKSTPHHYKYDRAVQLLEELE
jgi:hypothetical protein